MSLQLYAPTLGNSSSLIEYTFKALPHPTAAQPASTLHSTQTPVVVIGSGFVNSSSLLCRFGDSIANATFLNTSTLVCVTPRSLQAAGDVAVPLEVSVNGQDFSEGGLSFHFTACPKGAHCVSSVVLPCPRGTACQGMPNYNVTLCPVGTYQDQTGAATCKACLEGSFCPVVGLVRPLPCAAGFVCTRGEGSRTRTRFAQQVHRTCMPLWGLCVRPGVVPCERLPAALMLSLKLSISAARLPTAQHQRSTPSCCADAE